MLAKVTSKNQITLPKAVMLQMPPVEYFQVEAVNEQIILTPVQISKEKSQADIVRSQLAQLNLSQADIADAIAWARRD